MIKQVTLLDINGEGTEGDKENTNDGEKDGVFGGVWGPDMHHCVY